MRLVIRPIRYTSRVAQMRDWATRLGMATLLDGDSWVVLGAGHGRLALHAAEPGDRFDGSTSLAVETDDLDALERVWSDAGMATRRIDEHVPILFGSTPFGGEIAAGVLSPPPSGEHVDPGLSVMPMLVTSEVPAAADWFVSWGLRRRVTSDGGGWSDLGMPDGGGLVGIHHADNLSSAPPPEAPTSGDGDLREVPVGLTFEHPDVEALLQRLLDAGLDGAHVVDEAYNRTLLVPCPDGETIWVNGEQTDLYGYTRAAT